MENISTLTGKYGEEGDQLIFKILNSRIHDSKDKEALLKEFNLSLDGPRNSEILTEKALRYDLTVPFARFVVQHRNEIKFPFKRYQIQPVWRADRPQKGRYREFYQCDADIVGSNSLINEVELIQLVDDVFKCLDLNITIKLNNRKILIGLAKYLGVSGDEKIQEVINTIDKIEKISKEAFVSELMGKGIDEKIVKNLLQAFTEIENMKENIEKLDCVKATFFYSEDPESENRNRELRTIFNYLHNLKIDANVEFDITLARGLNYYTGTIFEVKVNNFEIGSVGGGGRYDDLTGIFEMPGFSGVGISFGIERIYDVMLQLNKFPDFISTSTKVLIAHFGDPRKPADPYILKAFSILKLLRKNSINAEIYPEIEKINKQFSYADARHIPFVISIGDDELKGNNITIKNMSKHEQEKIDMNDLANYIKNLLK